MATTKSYSDLQQSRKLAEILSLESADMRYERVCFDRPPEKCWYVKLNPPFKSDDIIPCWSLAALRNLLPTAIKPNKDSYLFLFESHNTFDNSWVYRYYNEDDTSYLYYKDTNEVDACYELILKLNELNLL